MEIIQSYTSHMCVWIKGKSRWTWPTRYI